MRAARVDRNHAEVVEALRKAGASVVSLASVGKGCPDIAAGYGGRTFLMEIKDGKKPTYERKLTELEQKFFDEWRGQVAVVTSVEEALAVIGIHTKGKQ